MCDKCGCDTENPKTAAARKGAKGNVHEHEHVHADGTVHRHSHDHSHGDSHQHVHVPAPGGLKLGVKGKRSSSGA
jgi:hydrogenase nickel incorporation protein HypB